MRLKPYPVTVIRDLYLDWRLDMIMRVKTTYLKLKNVRNMRKTVQGSKELSIESKCRKMFPLLEIVMKMSPYNPNIEQTCPFVKS